MENVSDEELRAKLAEKGHVIGPIQSSTRIFYQKIYLEIVKGEQEIKSPASSPEPLLLGTPLKKRPPTEVKFSPEPFTIPDAKKTKGIPTYCVPSLRRTTVERSALSKRLAEDTTVKLKIGEPVKGFPIDTPQYIKRTVEDTGIKLKKGEPVKGFPIDTPLSIKRTAENDTKASAKGLGKSVSIQRGLSNINRLNQTSNAPGYMKATTSTLKKDAVKPDVKSANSRMRRSIRLAKRRSVHRGVQPTPAIPKVGGSSIRKAKDSTMGSAAKGNSLSSKKKRAPWDTKGRLEDVSNLYNELKEEKSTLDEKLADMEAELEVNCGNIEVFKVENRELADNLAKTKQQLSGINIMCSKQQIELDAAILLKDEKIKSCNRMELEIGDMKDDLTKTKDELNGFMKRCSKQQIELDEATEQKNEKIKSCNLAKQERDEIEVYLKQAKKELREAEDRADNLERDARRANITNEEATDLLEKSRKYGSELENKLEELKLELSEYKRVSSQTISLRDGKIVELEGTLEKIKDDMGDNYNALRRKESEIKDLQRKVSESSEKLNAGELLRRKLHNTIQELKGNIRVYCRVRPFLDSEVSVGQPVSQIPTMEFSDDNTGVSVASLQGDKLGRKGDNLNHEFAFDHVFGPLHTQEDTFSEVAGLIQSSLDGYNVCIFAYGQTGSGKTHTMQGPVDPTSPHRGIIPRAMEQVFQTGEEMRDKGWSYEFTASFLEIYNETLHDLISDKKNEKIEIKLVNEKSREVEVTNVRNVLVSTPFDVHELLNKANKNRTVATTKCNERSSRSHSVYRLKIVGKNKSGESSAGNLNLVDLAGSERVASSGSTGQRLKEAQAINTSLSELGNVMMALQEKKTHIPYRNSKLTYLLCNSLGGNSKTLMFVNVSPIEKHTAESLNSLRFATKVNKVDLGTANKNK